MNKIEEREVEAGKNGKRRKNKFIKEVYIDKQIEEENRV